MRKPRKGERITLRDGWEEGPSHPSRLRGTVLGTPWIYVDVELDDGEVVQFHRGWLDWLELEGGRMRKALKEAAARHAAEIGPALRRIKDRAEARMFVVKHLDCADFPEVADELENMSCARMTAWVTLVLKEIAWSPMCETCGWVHPGPCTRTW